MNLTNKNEIQDEDIDKAVDFLITNADISAKYKAEKIYLESYTKSLKAILMAKHLSLPISAQEREALRDEQYIHHLKNLKMAIERDAKQEFLRKSAEAKIEAWRTKQANLRAIKI